MRNALFAGGSVMWLLLSGGAEEGCTIVSNDRATPPAPIQNAHFVFCSEGWELAITAHNVAPTERRDAFSGENIDEARRRGAHRCAGITSPSDNAVTLQPSHLFGRCWKRLQEPRNNVSNNTFAAPPPTWAGLRFRGWAEVRPRSLFLTWRGIAGVDFYPGLYRVACVILDK